MAVKTLTKAEAEILGIPIGVPLRARPVGYRLDHEQLLAYLQLADGSELGPIDCLPLLCWMEREEG